MMLSMPRTISISVNVARLAQAAGSEIKSNMDWGFVQRMNSMNNQVRCFVYTDSGAL
jgi:hypothetical protein